MPTHAQYMLTKRRDCLLCTHRPLQSGGQAHARRPLRKAQSCASACLSMKIWEGRQHQPPTLGVSPEYDCVQRGNHQKNVSLSIGKLKRLSAFWSLCWFVTVCSSIGSYKFFCGLETQGP